MVYLAIALLSLVAIVFASTASISGPRTATVGQLVTVKASDLKAGRYQLFLATPYDDNAKPGQTTQCTGAISDLQRAQGTASFSGTIPRTIDCRAYLTPDGKRTVTPGNYNFEVYSPLGNRVNRKLADVVDRVRIEK
jgi:hypothetical protein